MLTDAYPEMIYATAQDRLLDLKLNRLANEARSDRARRRRARLVARCRHIFPGR